MYENYLYNNDIKCTEYHKLITVADREDNLKDFQDRHVNIMVCTDHAARGLDLPFVRHVIQAQFASNVVQHMHRVGRASRAGEQGRATNFYDRDSQELVDAILLDKDTNSVGAAFSRRRGFRQKIKKENKKRWGN